MEETDEKQVLAEGVPHRYADRDSLAYPGWRKEQTDALLYGWHRPYRARVCDHTRESLRVRRDWHS